MDTLSQIFSGEGFMPHGHCYLWTPALLWTYVVSDTSIGIAFYSIPMALTYFVRKRTDLRFNWIFKLFSLFILYCGTTHLLSVWTIWHPDYWLDATITALTAIVSVITAIVLWPLIPKALKLPSMEQLQEAVRLLEKEVGERKAVETQLALLNETLEQRVDARTRELLEANQRLEAEIASRKNMERALHAEKERAQVTLKSIGDGVITTDVERKVVFLNPVAERLTGWTTQEAQGHHVQRVMHLVNEHNGERIPCPVGLVVTYGHTRKMQGEIILVGRYGQRHAVESAAAPMVDYDGKMLGTVLVLHDVTEARKAANRMTYLATHDALTGLPNRTLLHDRLQNALSLAERDDRKLAILFIDIDQFKNVNDSLGHDVGDRLLIEIARRFSALTRRSDTVCRQGGDEFIILLPEITEEYGPAEVAHKLLEALAELDRVDHQEIRVGGSIGIAIYPDNGRDADALIKHADLAMYHVKAAGRNGFQFFSEAMTEGAARRLFLESGLHNAIERGEFVVHYQPKVDLASGKIIGAEALLRWRHPTMGWIPPAEFIPVAEHSGLIWHIGSWVLREACMQNRAWQQAGLPMLPIAINLSPAQLNKKGFLEDVVGVLEDLKLPHHCLEFEVTESVSIHGAENAITGLKTLKDMGVRLSIDDFGTGYSSLSYLKRLPVDTIKIDKSFVRDITTDKNDAAIIEAIISMAHSLRLEVIAEGVETFEQREFLRRHGCDQIQGYYFSAPVPAVRFEEMLGAEEKMG
ncbi:bifunctional diguanylate cyclase/phosphodiesterase [Herbaspirillum sp. HC18]|nr:bifunctional diguanylate cyclase/phosphodiesterase [Herbaspirillum sp. HC18]